MIYYFICILTNYGKNYTRFSPFVRLFKNLCQNEFDYLLGSV